MGNVSYHRYKSLAILYLIFSLINLHAVINVKQNKTKQNITTTRKTKIYVIVKMDRVEVVGVRSEWGFKVGVN